MKLAEVLKSPDHWCKHHLHRTVEIDGKDVTQHCLWGAAITAERQVSRFDVLERLAGVFKDVYPEEYRKYAELDSVIDFNNREDVTFDMLCPIIAEYDRRFN